MPSIVLAEVARQPAGLLDQIVEDRYLGRAIVAFRANPATAEGELVDLVKEVQFEDVQAAIDAKKTP